MIDDPLLMTVERHKDYLVIRWDLDQWAEIDNRTMGIKLWEGPLYEVDKVLPEVLKKHGLELESNE